MNAKDNIIPLEELPPDVLVAAYFEAANTAEEYFDKGDTKGGKQWIFSARKFFGAMLKRRDEPMIDEAITDLEEATGIKVHERWVTPFTKEKPC